MSAKSAHKRISPACIASEIGLLGPPLVPWSMGMSPPIVPLFGRLPLIPCFTEPGSLFRRSVHGGARGMSLQPLVTFSSTPVLCHLLNSVFLSPSNLPSFLSFLFKFFYPVLVPFFRIWSHFAALYRFCQMLDFQRSHLSKATLSPSLSLPAC